MASSAPILPQSKRQARTVVFVSTHCPIRNWAEKRLYEPLADDSRLHSVYWDRGGLMTPRGREEAERYAIGLHEFRNRPWGLRPLLDYYRFILDRLDAIQAQDGIDYAIGCDTDVLVPLVWHRATRRLRYKIYREEVDYYAGSRHRGRRLKDGLMRLAFDAVEAVLHTACDKVFTLNRHAAARLKAWGVPERKIVIAGLWKKDLWGGEDREANKTLLAQKGVLTAEQVERLRGKVVVSFYGLFYEFTHLKALLDAVANHPEHVALLLAGKGKDQPVVEDYARRHPNILFFGWRDEDELRDFYRVTDIVYQPLDPNDNINWKYFGSTNKTFESLAAGCLFIGSAINERVDLNREADFALLIDFRRDVREQIEELFRAIEADREVLRRKQRNARLLFERYNHDAMVRVWRACFEAGETS